MSRKQSGHPVWLSDTIRVGKDQNLSLRPFGAPVARFMWEETTGMVKVSDGGKPLTDERLGSVVR